MIKLFFALLFLLVVFMSLGSAAFGVNSACDDSDCYWKGRPLEVEAGEERELYFGLQNGNEESVILDVEVIEGLNFVDFADEELRYVVEPGETERIYFKLKIPEDAGEEDEYKVSILVREASSEEEGMVQLSMSIGNSFSALVLKAPSDEDKGGSVELIMLIVLIVLAMVLFVVLFVIIRMSRKEIGVNPTQGMAPANL